MSRRDAHDLRDYLLHILEAAERVQRFLTGLDRDAFLADELRQDAVLRNFEVLGEAASNVSRHFPEFVTAHPEVPWKSMVGMRKIIAHAYFRADLDTVWRTAQTAVPAMAEQIRALVESLPEPEAD